MTQRPSQSLEVALDEKLPPLEDGQHHLHRAQRHDHAAEKRHARADRDAIVAGALKGVRAELCAASARCSSQSQPYESDRHHRWSLDPSGDA